MRIYLDYNATTPVDKEVSQAMQPYLNEYFGNPSSSHGFGTETKRAVEIARKQVASLINCKPGEIIFTSGGTESNNFAVKGFAFANIHKGNHIITSSVEHPAVTEVCRYLENKGFRITWLPVDESGLVDLSELEAAITSQTILISVMHANNEIGTIQPLKEICEIARRHNIAVHSDAAQSVGKYPVDVMEMDVDMLSIAGHKLYAPKGVGALYIRDGIRLEKLIHGADHEQNKRAGTENVPEIVALGKACEIAGRELPGVMAQLAKTRDMLYDMLLRELPDIKLNGHPRLRLPNTLSLGFRKIEANILLNEMALKGIAASAGAACHTDSIDVSPVLTAIKLDTEFAMGTIRFSTGRYTTEDEISRAAEIITGIVKKMRPAELPSTPEQDGGETEVRLTSYTQGLGCACKLRPQELEKILKDLPLSTNPDILIDSRNSDDAAVYRINETTAVVQTVDFFTPIVDSPYDFGAIAAANALSDIYAMGARPLFALNIAGFPSNRLPVKILKEILRGAGDKALEAGINILGGHTIDDPEPKYGMVVTGIAHPGHIWANAGAKAGDAIILTKAIGTGILTTALKRGLIDEKTRIEVIRSMSELNNKAAEILKDYSVHACTDITGFGLIGHLSEVTLASKVNAEIFALRVPVFEGTSELAAAGVIPGGSANNLTHFSKHVTWEESLSDLTRIILCDAQTSGGLLVTVPPGEAAEILEKLHGAGISHATHIGYCLSEGPGKIFVKRDDPD
ncbi:MAG: selenide, water dikinase SelD [Bacteroidales bacterium]|nr:selenide, water dikinase SelD [Bacteroidales bacterium]